MVRLPNSSRPQMGMRGRIVAVPMRRAGGALLGDSLYVSISGMRDGADC